MIMYDKIDPSENGYPFIIIDDGKFYQIIQKKEKKILFGIIITLISLIISIFYIGGIWNPIKKVMELNYIIVNNDKGCYTSIVLKWE